jgi:manganese/zinc/iron transport system substrate-binding protein
MNTFTLSFWSNRVVMAVLVAMGVMLAAGCERSQGAEAEKNAGAAKPESGDSKPTLVATVGMLADPARTMAGGRVDVTGLLGEGVDPHTYKASPGDLRVLTGAGTVLAVGHKLEGQLGESLDKLQGRTRVVKVGEKLDDDILLKASEAGKIYDPHVWNDVAVMRKMVEVVRDELVLLTPASKDAIMQAHAEYDAKLAKLDGYLKELMATIPADKRVLVTAHDAFAYLGRAYGLEVLAIQGISTESEASLQDINAIVELVSSRKVPAVFIESSVPRKTIEALIEGCKARGHRVVIGGELYSDSLGKAGTREGTYIGMMLHNGRTIAKALGDASKVAGVAVPVGLEEAVPSGGGK